MAINSEKISSSLEDYLEVIAEILEQNKHAHTKDIADKLGIKMPSVTNALQTLSAKGLIFYQPHSPVILTAAGTERAAVIRRRHAALKTFFSEILKMKETDADATACKVEHVVSEEVMSRFVALTDAILKQPGAEELRKYLDKTMPNLVVHKEEENLISLDKLSVGECAIVVKISNTLRGVKKFADLGLVPGTLLEMEGHAPFGDLMRVRVMGSSLSMRAKDASYIWVRPTDTSVEPSEPENALL